jgi:hypothetical protein
MILKFPNKMQAIILNKELAAKIKEQEAEAKRREKEALKQIKKDA